MKPIVFVDTDILVDLLSRRKPFLLPAAQLFSSAERGEIEACISSLSFATLSYLLRKNLPAPLVTEALKGLRALVTVLAVDESVIDRAIDSRFAYFEDAIQYFAAIDKGVSVIVTRNTKDFAKSRIRVCSAEEFLAGTETGP
jgi:predicted nucleic acid-binding protein